MTERMSPADAGCYFDSRRGHYIVRDVILFAAEHGRPTDPFVMYAMGRYDEDYLLDEYPTGAMDEEEAMCEEWLTEHIAPEGYSFGFNEGDFGLYPDEGE